MKTAPVVILILLSFHFGFGTEYQVDKSQKNQVKFISNAPMEDFEGVTNKIDGYIFWGAEAMLDSSEMYFEVDLNSLDTGIGLRNRHMRENYLETDKYPFAHFTGSLVWADKIAEGGYDVAAEGVMFIHGLEKNIYVRGQITATPGGYRIQAKFVTPLSDYNIEVPKLMFFKIDENMKLELDFFIKKADNN